MQNPNEDTEWNDVLRAKGILPPKEEPTISEDTVVQVSLLITALSSETRNGEWVIMGLVQCSDCRPRVLDCKYSSS